MADGGMASEDGAPITFVPKREDDTHLRKLALQLATQLPDDHREANAVLRILNELTNGFLFIGRQLIIVGFLANMAAIILEPDLPTSNVSDYQIPELMAAASYLAPSIG